MELKNPCTPDIGPGPKKGISPTRNPAESTLRYHKMEANYPPHMNIFPPKAILKMISFVGYVTFLKSNHWSRRIPRNFLVVNFIEPGCGFVFLFSAAQFWHQNNPVKTAENSCHVVVGVPLVSGSWWWVGLLFLWKMSVIFWDTAWEGLNLWICDCFWRGRWRRQKSEYCQLRCLALYRKGCIPSKFLEHHPYSNVWNLETSTPDHP